MTCKVVGCNYPEGECSGSCVDIFKNNGIDIHAAKIVEIIKPEYYVESDMFGTKTIMVKYPDQEAFPFIQILYDWRITSNSGQYQLAQEIIKLIS